MAIARVRVTYYDEQRPPIEVIVGQAERIRSGLELDKGKQENSEYVFAWRAWAAGTRQRLITEPFDEWWPQVGDCDFCLTNGMIDRAVIEGSITKEAAEALRLEAAEEPGESQTRPEN